MKQQSGLQSMLACALVAIVHAQLQDASGTCTSADECLPTRGGSVMLQVSKHRELMPDNPGVSLANISEGISPSGAGAPLTRKGYAAVADRCCQAEMEQFISRVAFDLKVEICNEGGIHGLVPFHTCEKGPQTYNDLTAELLRQSADRCSAFASVGACAPRPADCPETPPNASATVSDCSCSASKAAKLDFSRAYLGQNNLGGIGPDTGVQEMRYINIFGHPFPIRWTLHPEICMDVQYGEYRNGANIVTHACENNGTHFNMQWTLPPSGTGLIRWTPHPDKCFDVSGGSTANGANLQLWDCDETNANQKWIVPASGSGPIKWAAHPNKCIDVSGGSTARHTNMQMWDCDDNNNNLKFTVPAVSDATDLVVTATTAYSANSNAGVPDNMKNGFGSLTLRWDTSTDFKFQFVESGTSTPRTIEEFHMAFFDLDSANAGAEFVSANGYKGYVTDVDTSLAASALPSGRTKFTGTASVPNPTAPGTATDAQRKASVMFFFKNSSEFQATFGFEGPGPFDPTNPGQNALLLFSGSSVLVDRCAA